MNGYEWKEGLTPEESKNGAYWERNMVALAFADGWYYDKENNWDGWKRVLSCKNGTMCFHIPDDFEVGSLPEIKPNWDGHSTRQKWDRVAKEKNIKLNWK